MNTKELPKTLAGKVKENDVNSELEKLKKELERKNKELESMKELLPKNDFITLRGQTSLFSIVIEGRRCMFINHLFTTRDRALADMIKAHYPTIVEIENEPVQPIMQQVGQVI